MNDREIQIMLDGARTGEVAGVLPYRVGRASLYELADLADEFGHPVRRVVTTGRYPHVMTRTGVRILASGWVGKA